jgi:hypothetical protein
MYVLLVVMWYKFADERPAQQLYFVQQTCTIKEWVQCFLLYVFLKSTCTSIYTNNGMRNIFNLRLDVRVQAIKRLKFLVINMHGVTTLF